MKRFLRSRWLAPVAGVLVVGATLAWYFTPAAAADKDALVARVKRGDFKVTVTTAGELRAKKFVQVQGPLNMQQADVYQTKIATLVAEGTVVKEGDVVADLDRAGIAAKLAEVSLNLQKADAQYTGAQLDSALNLSKAREEMRTLEFAMEEKRLAKEQAVYEAPTIKRQAEIDYEKATRALAQAKIDYVTKTNQAIAKMREIGADVERQRNKLKIIQDVMSSFSIKAPAPGMVIYVKEWNGKKKSVGSQVSAWDPTVATLPDLSLMESITYVNEIDVRKLGVGQRVKVALDADPSKQLTGKVTAVANVGEQRPNADAKVFEVKIVVEQADTTLRPGMTTANAIETYAIKNALFVPLEAVTSEGSIPFVYKRDGGGVVKQEIETGAMNDNEIVVARGLAEGDRVLMAPPANKDHIELVRLPGSKAQPPKGPGADTPLARPVPQQAPAAAGSPTRISSTTGTATARP
jgi:RND family efflux transporter MFP subunit